MIDYIKNLHFDEEDISYLRSLSIFDEDFLTYLSHFYKRLSWKNQSSFRNCIDITGEFKVT